MDDLDLLEGRPARLFVLDFGFFRVHAGPRDIGIVGFLIETDRGERLLVDSGFPAKYADDPAAATALAAALGGGLGLFAEIGGPDDVAADAHAAVEARDDRPLGRGRDAQAAG